MRLPFDQKAFLFSRLAVLPQIRRPRGQTSVEYLLLLAVVAVVIIAGFGPGALVDQVHNQAESYYNTITTVILDNGTNPNAIDGGWCPVTCPPAGGAGMNVFFGVCECPAPAFGGKFCPSNPFQVNCTPSHTCRGPMVSCVGIQPCSCPTGMVCDATGKCVCPTGLNCSSIPNASPDVSCTKCLCWAGTFWNPTGGPTGTGSCDFCTPAGGHCTYSFDGLSCSQYNCPGNQACDVSHNACKCPSGTAWNGTTCTGLSCWPNPPCPLANGCGKDNCGTICGINGGACPSGETCSNGVGPSGGPGICNCHPQNPCPTSNGCGQDDCGKSCGTCPANQPCSNTTGGPGTCGCSGPSCPCSNPGPCSVSAQCGWNLGLNNCGLVCIGQANLCPAGHVPPYVCDPQTFTCICGMCQLPPGSCNDPHGFDLCGNPCLTTPGTCTAPNTCNAFNICQCTIPGTCLPLAGECCGPGAVLGDPCTKGADSNCGTPCNVMPPPCPGPSTCNAFNVCSCSPTDCAGFTCGLSALCGTPCPPNSCGPGTACSSTTTPGNCVACTLPTCPPGANCGTVTNACGNTSCWPPGQSSCVNPFDTCGAVTANVCGCNPQNCTSLGACGSVSDGCGNTLSCGGCTAPQTCGGGGVPNKCGCTPLCSPTANCGDPDSCGGKCQGICANPATPTCVNGTCQCVGNCAGKPCGANDGCGGTCQTGSCSNQNEICSNGTCICPVGGGCNGAKCGPDACGHATGCGTCPGGTCVSGTCQNTITLLMSEYANCAQCLPLCNLFQVQLGLGGNCGKQAACGGSPGNCPISYAPCTQDPNTTAWTCGSCLSETVTSGLGCPNGVASVISQSPISPTSGNCGNGPTPGTATVTITVACN